jgi:hypothetical protein
MCFEGRPEKISSLSLAVNYFFKRKKQEGLSGLPSEIIPLAGME